MQIVLIIVVLLLGYKINKPHNKKNLDPIVIRENSLLYQYIIDAHCLVIDIVGVDPLKDPVRFHKTLTAKMSTVNAKIEDLRAKYMLTLAEDTEFGQTLQNYDFWRQKRSSWILKKKCKLHIAQ